MPVSTRVHLERHLSVTTSRSPARLASSVEYEIRVEGVLDERWSTWFDELQIRDEGETTVIAGAVTDQAALQSLLAKVSRLGLSLISVRRI
jgi:hypothetical protein